MRRLAPRFGDGLSRRASRNRRARLLPLCSTLSRLRQTQVHRFHLRLPLVPALRKPMHRLRPYTQPRILPSHKLAARTRTWRSALICEMSGCSCASAGGGFSGSGSGSSGGTGMGSAMSLHDMMWSWSFAHVGAGYGCLNGTTPRHLGGSRCQRSCIAQLSTL